MRQDIRMNRTIETSERKFDVKTLPDDMRRVHDKLASRFGEEYALLWVFTLRTATELHRAWHMTLLTSALLLQIKKKFGLRMTWNLGVFKCIFRVEDGDYEIHRKVPYDYDSEYQDIYYRIAEALIEEQITVHEALIYQTEAKHGLHTSRIGRFLRDFPGRLVLYPFQASTIAYIFFEAKFYDMGVAAVVGLAAGLMEYALSHVGGQAKVLIDVVVGLTVGIISGLWYDYRRFCVPSVFLGVLYWFFYGTAFVVGILEIIAGELETGVTRFIAVSVKTFVLSLGASLGLMISVGGDALKTWQESQSDEYCEPGQDMRHYWWRYPMYIASSVAVLGQYRLPPSQYPRALIVMTVGYAVQYESFIGFGQFYSVDGNDAFTEDHLDTAASNVAGAAAATVTALFLSWFINTHKQYYRDRVLNKVEDPSAMGNFIFGAMRLSTYILGTIGLLRESDYQRLDLDEKLTKQKSELDDETHERQRYEVTQEEENLFLELLVSSEDLNPWAILMPAVYQLVPGSVIAKLWFASIFPPSPDDPNGTSTDSVFSNLMVVSVSLALGLIFGFAIVQTVVWVVGKCNPRESESKEKTRLMRQEMMEGMYTSPETPEDDPASIRPEDKEEESADSMAEEEISS